MVFSINKNEIKITELHNDICTLPDILNENSEITSLDLSNCKMGSKEISLLMDILEKNKVITTLDLSWNEFGAIDIEVFISRLKKNWILSSINLEGNPICFEGALLMKVDFLLQRNKFFAPSREWLSKLRYRLFPLPNPESQQVELSKTKNYGGLDTDENSMFVYHSLN